MFHLEKFGIGLPGFRNANSDRFESHHLGCYLDRQFHLDQVFGGCRCIVEFSNRGYGGCFWPRHRYTRPDRTHFSFQGFGTGDHSRSHQIRWDLHHRV